MIKDVSKRMKRNFRYDGRVYTVYGYSDRELDRKEAKKRAALERDEIIVESTMTVEAWAEKFVEAYKVNSMKDYVFDNYRWSIKHYILEEIGHMQLKKVKPLHLQNILNGLDDKSESLIHKVYLQMNELFAKAVENGLISKNPAATVSVPKGYKGARRALTTREEAAFLAAAKKHPHGLLYMFMWGCGCRPSEAERIKGRDIQLIDGRLYLHIRGSKTKAADRLVPIPSEVAEMLPDSVTLKNRYYLPLVTTSEGNAISARRQRGAWQNMERLMNIELGCRMYRNQLIPPYPLADDLTSYHLRHTYCTNLQKKGVDIRTAQYLMGHSSIKMTADIYSHTTVEELGNVYDQITGNKADEEGVSQSENEVQKMGFVGIA